MQKNKKMVAKAKQGKPRKSFSAKDAEFAILKVAYLLAAVDGEVAESERKTFDALAEHCRDVDVDESKQVIKSARLAVENMLKAYKKSSSQFTGMMRMFGGVAQEDAMRIFMDEVRQVCDWSQFVRDSARVRRAFVMWMAMVMADGVLAKEEEKAIKQLQILVNSYKLVDDSFIKSAQVEISYLNQFHKQLNSAEDIEEDRRLHERIEDTEIRLANLIQA